MEDHHEASLEIIDAFIDGERVDTDALKDALATAAGRDYFVDVWQLREAVRADPARETPVVTPPVAATKTRRTSPLWMAAAVATALIGGYAAGQTIGRGMAAREVANPAISPVAVSPTPRGNDGAFPVPAPTRVIQLEFHSTSATNGGD